MNEDDLMERFYKTLKIAARNDAILMVMDTLVKIAELLIAKHDQERAVEILVFVFQYPLRPETHERAETMLRRMEAEVNPQVMVDARTLANELTLDDLLAVIIGKDS